MKKIIALLIPFILCFAMASCGGEAEYSKLTYKNFVFTSGDVFLDIDPEEKVNLTYNFKKYDDPKSLAAETDCIFTATVIDSKEAIVPAKDVTVSELEQNRDAYPEKFEENIYQYEIYTITEVKVDTVYSGDLKTGDVVYVADVGDGKNRVAEYITKSGGYPEADDKLLLFANKEKREKYPDMEIYLDEVKIDLYTATLGRRYFIEEDVITLNNEYNVFPKDTKIADLNSLIK